MQWFSGRLFKRKRQNSFRLWSLRKKIMRPKKKNNTSYHGKPIFSSNRTNQWEKWNKKRRNTVGQKTFCKLGICLVSELLLYLSVGHCGFQLGPGQGAKNCAPELRAQAVFSVRNVCRIICFRLLDFLVQAQEAPVHFGRAFSNICGAVGSKRNSKNSIPGTLTIPGTLAIPWTFSAYNEWQRVRRLGFSCFILLQSNEC